MIAHEINNNNFLVFDVSATGVNPTPTVSNLGISHNISNSVDMYNGVGHLKVSLDGSKLALAYRGVNANGSIGPNKGVYLYDFDNTSTGGIISNEIYIPGSSAISSLYGLEFSPDGNQLYIGDISSIYRADLIGMTAITIMSTTSPINNAVRAIQIGPDKNIYVALNNSNSVGRILDPNSNVSQFDPNAIMLSAGTVSKFGLPNLVRYHTIPNSGFNYTVDSICSMDTIIIPQITGLDGGTFSSIPNGLDINSTTGEINIFNSLSGNYTITYSIQGPCAVDSSVQLVILPKPVNDPILNMIVCEEEPIGPITFTSSPNSNFYWNNDNDAIGLTYNGQGDIGTFSTPDITLDTNATIQYWSEYLGCMSDTSTFSIEVLNSTPAQINYSNSDFCISSLNAIPNVSGSTYGTFDFLTLNGGPNLELDTSTGEIDLSLSNIGSYQVIYSPSETCTGSDTFSISIMDSLTMNFSFGDMCQNEVNQVPDFIFDENGTPFSSIGTSGLFTFSPNGLVIDSLTGEIDAQNSVSGSYLVTNTSNFSGCPVASFSDSIEIYQLPTINFFAEPLICHNDSVLGINLSTTTDNPLNIEYSHNGTQYLLNIPSNNSPSTFNVNLGLGSYHFTQITDHVNGCSSLINEIIELDTLTRPQLSSFGSLIGCEGNLITPPAFDVAPVNSTINWENNGMDVGFGISGTGNLPNFTGVPGSTIIRAVPYSDIITQQSPQGCQGDTTLIEIMIFDLPYINFNHVPFNGCAPQEIQFNNLSDNSISCIWSINNEYVSDDCNPMVLFTDPGNYDVQLEILDSNGCSNSISELDLIQIPFSPIAEFVMSHQNLSSFNSSIDFTNQSLHSDHYMWNFGDNSDNSELEHPTHTFSDAQTNYTISLFAFNSDSTCMDSTQKNITFEQEMIFYVPNVFTPDGNDYNNDFKPIFASGILPEDFHMSIFNRWGELLFETYNANVGWDGTYGQGGLVQDGVYIWKIKFREFDNEIIQDFIGHVTMLK